MPITNAKVQLSGIDGNALVIIGTVAKAIRRSDKPEEVNNFTREAMSGNYDHVLQTCMKYVDVS